MQENILITGGSGMIGRELTKLLLEQGYAVGWLSRSSKAVDAVRIFTWDVQTGLIDTAAIAWADVIIHLAGEGIADKRWTRKRKKKIIESRSKSSELLIRTMRSVPNRIKTVIAASAIGWYGDTHGNVADETTPAGTGFLSTSVITWEEATSAFAQLHIRLVRLRIGIVLSNRGGALKELLMTEWFRVLPVLGTGRQTYAWIHIHDVCRMILFAMQHPVEGIFNATAPFPVSQRELMQQIRKVKHRFYFLIPVPAFSLKLYLGEMADAVLTDQNVSSKKIADAGFRFAFEKIDKCMSDLSRTAADA